MARKSRFRRKLRDVGRKAARVGSVAAPIVGGFLGGPLGAAAGGAVGAGLSQVHQRRGSKRARLRRSLLATGGAVAGSGALSLLGGGGLTTGALPNLSRIFGGASPGSASSASTPEAAGLDFGQNLGKTSNSSPSVGGSATGGSIWDFLGGRGSQSVPPGAHTPGTMGDPNQESLGGGVFPGAGMDLLSAPGTEGEDQDKRLLIVVAIGAAILFFARKKA